MDAHTYMLAHSPVMANNRGHEEVGLDDFSITQGTSVPLNCYTGLYLPAALSSADSIAYAEKVKALT